MIGELMMIFVLYRMGGIESILLLLDNNSSKNLVLGKTPAAPTAPAGTVLEVVLIETDYYYFSIESTVVMGDIEDYYEGLKLIDVRKVMGYFGKLDVLILLAFSLLLLVLSLLFRLIFLSKLSMFVLVYPLKSYFY